MAHGKKYLPILSEGKCQKPYHLAPDVIYLSMMIFYTSKYKKYRQILARKIFISLEPVYDYLDHVKIAQIAKKIKE